MKEHRTKLIFLGAILLCIAALFLYYNDMYKARPLFEDVSQVDVAIIKYLPDSTKVEDFDEEALLEYLASCKMSYMGGENTYLYNRDPMEFYILLTVTDKDTQEKSWFNLYLGGSCAIAYKGRSPLLHNGKTVWEDVADILCYR